MTMPISRNRSLIIELAVATVAILVASRLLFMARANAAVGPFISTIVAILLIYVPVFVLWRRARAIDFLDRSSRAYARSAATFVVTALTAFPLFLLAAHGWQIVVFKYHGFQAAGYPHFWSALAYQILLVALPEEFYFRGYFQSAMNMMTEKRWRILGVNLGWGWIITAGVFAFAHSVISYQWWHFSIFFPALLFGYLRERTGSITAPILFHAASNLLMDWFARSYF